jgi:hypothetical protein
MQSEMLYQKALTTMGFQEDFRNHKQTVINIPIMDFDRLDRDILPLLLRYAHPVKMGRSAHVLRFSTITGLIYMMWKEVLVSVLTVISKAKNYRIFGKVMNIKLLGTGFENLNFHPVPFAEAALI